MINKAKITIISVGTVYLFLALCCMGKPADKYSVSERRPLTQKPVFSWNSFVSGEYGRQVEKYVTDQFPMRDKVRSLKTYFSMGIMKKSDTNGIYLKDGYLCAMEYPMDEASLTRAAGIFRGIYDKYLKGTDVNAYFSIIPDKGYFLSQNRYLSLDYEEFFEKMYAGTDFMTAIPIEDRLELTDYYKTDTHWKQEKIVDVAEKIAEKMGVSVSGKYVIKESDMPFYGVYYGQAALDVKPDQIKYCTNDVLRQCIVYDHENDREIKLYDEERMTGRDPYEMFLGGNLSLVTIENPMAASLKELVVFGDSFSRSLVPFLAEAYRKVTMIDIRYLPGADVGNYVSFGNQDVLFLYSTSVLNNSITLK